MTDYQFFLKEGNKDKFDLDYHQFIDKNECARA